jgi:hypothetical protein
VKFVLVHKLKEVFKPGFFLRLIGIFAGFVVAPSLWGSSSPEFSVYQIYRGVDLGVPGEAPPQKDYYLNMGSAHGLKKGSLVVVFRRAASFDMLNQQYLKDVAFPIAQVKVIHVDSITSIARLEKMLPLDSTPAISPRAIMVGDLVKVRAESNKTLDKK